MINIQNLSLRAGVKPLLDSANLAIHPGQKIGLVGQNGAGKTTLFRAILGQVTIDAGNLGMPAEWVIGYVEQETDAKQQTVIEYVSFGDELYAKAIASLKKAEAEHNDNAIVAAYDQLDKLHGYAVENQTKQLLYGLGFSEEDFSKSIDAFSGGWQVRLKLARALMQRSDLLLLDEPTNHLDIEAVSWLKQWLKSFDGAVLVISHDRDFLDQVVQGIAHIDNQKINFYQGNFAAFERQRNERLMQQQALHDKQKQQMQHLKTFISRFKAKASKAKQAQSRVKALERMEMVAAVQASNPFHFEFAEPKSQPDPMLKIENLSFAYPDKPIINEANLTLRSGDRIGLVGVNGSGKTTLLKLIVGELKPVNGKVISARGVKVGYFSQHQLETLRPEWSPLKHLLALEDAPSDQQARDFLGGFGFSNEQCLESIAPFSGGEKARLALAIIVFQEPNLIILDEPTNHLDMETRDALEMALNDYSGALLLVSHDKHLLASIADQYWWVHQGMVELFYGDLDQYLSEQLKRIKQSAEAQKQMEGADDANKSQNKKQQRIENANLRKQLDQLIKADLQRSRKLEKELDKAQGKLGKLHQKMEDSSLYDDANKDELSQCLQQEADCQALIEALEMEWMEVEETIQAKRDEFESGL
ncbi:ATP-binding cassette domain-containing protein [Thiomicrorhabdus sp. 6S2-11]|uniref:ATP-binding cassette domain-containing protein n=1 Tax=Thiomicrorhabdus marina TaxID=2818442 RepID=A0ABS3Q3G9_9GAMM|nr:ATP-binding cassette domain-containing protein [Thiomicrorhabdus marina]MBO1926688.1 ATP-binding cassette domain-containing protein [Thiomicrorhabdus marina]